MELEIYHAFTQKKKTLGLAESCTGGAIAARLTRVPGASEYLLGSVVAYSNDWKERFLNVSPKTLQEFGAVSRETLSEMLEGIFSLTSADYAVAVSGVAGPSGGSAASPVGTIYVGIGKRGEPFDIGVLQAPEGRLQAIDFTVEVSLIALLERLLYDKRTFS